jgi:hypothetical protein
LGFDANRWSFVSLLNEPLPRATIIDYDAWEKITFSEQDLFALPVSVVRDDLRLDLNYNNGSLLVTDISTMFSGKCYSISPQVELRANKAVLITLRYPWSKKNPLVTILKVLQSIPQHYNIFSKLPIKQKYRIDSW